MSTNKALHPLKGRWFSVVFAIMGIAFVWGRVLTNQPAPHSAVMIILIGCAVCIVHGAGWKPKALWERFIFSPILGWPLLAIGFGMAYFN